jgi:hypothetical protein
LLLFATVAVVGETGEGWLLLLGSGCGGVEEGLATEGVGVTLGLAFLSSFFSSTFGTVFGFGAGVIFYGVREKIKNNKRHPWNFRKKKKRIKIK